MLKNIFRKIKFSMSFLESETLLDKTFKLILTENL